MGKVIFDIHDKNVEREEAGYGTHVNMIGPANRGFIY